MPTPAQDIDRTFRRTLVAVGVVAAAALIWIAHDVILLVVAGILLGIFLDGITGIISRFSRLPRGWSLLITILFLICFLCVVVSIVAPGIVEQVKTFEVTLPQSIAHLRNYILQYPWGAEIVENFPSVGSMAGASNTYLSKFTGALSSTLNVIFRTVLVLVIGIYSASEPVMYRSGFMRLFAPQHHERIERVLFAVHDRMWWWLISIGGAMLSLAVLTYIGLSILGLPLAFSLALFTGLMTCIPNIGPIISGVPPVLIGLTISPGKALSVLLVYVLIQIIESHIVTPLIQRRTIRMPPVLGISAQLIFSVLFGFIGLLLAAPIMAAILAVLESTSNERAGE